MRSGVASGKTGTGRLGLTRREFLRAAGGLVVAVSLWPERPAVGAAAGEGDRAGWLRVGEDGRVTVFAPVPEAGQALRTELAQLAAEELRLPISALEVILGDTHRVPPDITVCAGSAISTLGPEVRRAAAEAREALAKAAAEQWRVPPEQVQLREGRALLISDTDTAVPIGDLAQRAAEMRRAGGPAALTPPAEHRVVGKSVPSLDGPAYVTGEARYAADLRPPGLAYGKVLRPPYLGGRLLSLQTRAAAAQPGVIAVVEEDDLVGVVATRPDVAERAALSLRATWGQGLAVSGASLYEDLRASAELEAELASQGDVEAALAGARQGYSASYRTPFVAHAPMEPHAALAAPEGERVVVHASTQRPFQHQAAVAGALGIPAARVRVICPAVGGAFGGKDSPEVSVQAARLARAVGRPVLVAQSREEELGWNYFRPAAVIDVRCGVAGDGRIAAWDCDVLNCGSRGALAPYRFENHRVRVHRCRAPLPQGPWRGMGGAANAFAREVHLDYVASQLGTDPIGLRLRHLEEAPRLARVVCLAAERHGWRDRRPPTGLGSGFACAVDAGSFAAVIADVEVERTSGHVRVRRVFVVQDSGLVINPDNMRSQIEGAVVMGLGFTLREAVRYEQGRILTRSFASYPIPTFYGAPAIDIVLDSDRHDLPRGGGTAALCAIAPAVANAIFDAVGKRLRELPLSPARVRSAP
jgi:isoquinoline 1-oxidoreductase